GRSLENDQRAVLGLTDEERGAHELVDDPLELLFTSRREKPVEWPELTDLAERATQVGLEHDDERDEGYREEGLQKGRRERQVQRVREELTLRFRDLALAEGAHDVDEEALRVVVRDPRRDKLEKQVRRRVEVPFLHVVAGGLERFRRGSRIAGPEIERRIGFD